MEHTKTRSVDPKAKIVRTFRYKHAYVTVMAVLIIFYILCRVTNLRMPSIGGQGVCTSE